MKVLALLMAISVSAGGPGIEWAFQQGGAKGVESAAKAIEKAQGTAEAIQTLSRVLWHDDAQLRAAAAHALGALGERGEHALLEAYQAIKTPRDERLVPMLTEGLSHGNFDVQWYAAAHLAELKAKAAPARASLVRLLEEEPKREKRRTEFFSASEVRAKAAFALGCIGVEPDQTVRLLTRMLRHQDREIRIWSAFGLGQMEGKAQSAIPALIERMADQEMILPPGGCIDSAHPDHSAATALVGIGSPALPALIQALGSKQAAVRCHAADALWYFGEDAKPATDALLRLLRDEEPKVQCQAVKTLVWITPDVKILASELDRLTQDADRKVRMEAALGLGYLKPREQVPLDPLMSLLEDPVAEVRLGAFEALEQVAPRKVLESATARMLKDDDAGNRDAALQMQKSLRSSNE